MIFSMLNDPPASSWSSLEALQIHPTLKNRHNMYMKKGTSLLCHTPQSANSGKDKGE